MGEAFMFWVMKPIAEMVIGLGVVAAMLVVYALFSLPQWLQQRRCKHTKVREDGSCNAWCCACNKNLGFIGAWRERNRDA